MAREKDRLFATPLQQMVDFRFDERVVSVFPDMIQRSVPGYATLITNIGTMAARYVQPESVCYDLGCSLGAVSLSLRHAIREPACKIIAVDNSEAMIDKARRIFADDEASEIPVEVVCADINEVSIDTASVVVMNFTLQFIQPAQRQALIQTIYDGLLPGGILILSEKLAFEDPQADQFHIDSHHDFKRANGYSDLEISQKRSALEQVLIPETLAQHQLRLQQAGFGFVEKWYQCFNFVSMVAVK
jgi:tRNA (cmo5U34)-methyltransferase